MQWNLKQSLYDSTENVLKQVPQKDIIYTLDALSANIGSQAETDITGSFGFGRGVIQVIIWFNFCHKNWFWIMNAWFKRHRRCFYIWRLPNKLHHKQINYILCIHQRSSSVLAVKNTSGYQLQFSSWIVGGLDQSEIMKHQKEHTGKEFGHHQNPCATQVKNKFELLNIIWEDARWTLTGNPTDHHWNSLNTYHTRS